MQWASVSGFYSATLPPSLPLAVIADSPYSVAKYSINVPLVTVDRSELPIIRNADISAVSPTRPLVTCRTPQYVTVRMCSPKMLRFLTFTFPSSSLRFPVIMKVESRCFMSCVRFRCGMEGITIHLTEQSSGWTSCALHHTLHK